MSKKTLIILTHHFPVATGEAFLVDELEITAPYFDKIIICPNNADTNISNISMPSNTSITLIGNSRIGESNYKYLRRMFPILWEEFLKIPSKRLFLSLFKFHCSLLKQCYHKALNIMELVKADEQTIIYTYWCDDLAITGSFCKQLLPNITFISRAHGFDVFEEQSDVNYIFFRNFQLKYLDKLWTVSKTGAQHLKNKNPLYKNKIDTYYLGIKSDGKIGFKDTSVIRLATCSFVRSIKRLDKLIDALKLITDKEIEWHVIGDGPDLEKLKDLSKELSINCKLIFHGQINTAAIHQLYSTLHFDFLVSLSSSEGLPVSMMEAISHGIPILSTDVGGCKEIVTVTTGILIPIESDGEQIAALIRNCKQGIFNNLTARQLILSFWIEAFNSTKNYKKFAENLLTI